jgi:hypothetical protein
MMPALDVANLPVTFDIGNQAPPDWKPTHVIRGRVSLAKLADNSHTFITECQTTRLSSLSDLAGLVAPVEFESEVRDIEPPLEPEIDIIGDSFVTLQLDQSFTGWATEFAAIQTAVRQPRDYFNLTYWDGAQWIDRAAAHRRRLKTKSIAFGARWKWDILPRREIHKIWYGFLMGDLINH